MRKSHVGLLHKKLVYALHFFLFISRHRAGQKQSKCELGKWECIVLGFSVHFHLLSVMFWKDNLPLLGNQLPSISSCFGHLSASSGSILIFSLCSSQRWALRFHLWCEEVGSRKVRHVQVPWWVSRWILWSVKGWLNCHQAANYEVASTDFSWGAEPWTNRQTWELRESMLPGNENVLGWGCVIYVFISNKSITTGHGRCLKH